MTTAATPFNEDMPKLKASELETMIGKEVGVSKWIVIDQKKIDTFAELTHDTYFIHTDPVRAKKVTRFGKHNRPWFPRALPAERLRL